MMVMDISILKRKLIYKNIIVLLIRLNTMNTKTTIITDWILTDLGEGHSNQVALEIAEQLSKGNIETVENEEGQTKITSLLNVLYQVNENIKYEIGEVINVKYTEINNKPHIYVQLLLFPQDVEMYQINVNNLYKQTLSLPITFT
jgi:hypothetical protein